MNNTIPAIDKPQRGRPKTKPVPDLNRSVDIQRAVKLRFKGLTLQEIADTFGVTKQCVHQRLSRFNAYLEDPPAVQAYQQHEVNFIDSTREIVLSHIIDRLKVRKEGLGALTMAFGVLFDKSRILKGLSTQNISVHMQLSEIKRDLDQNTDLVTKARALLQDIGAGAEDNVQDNPTACGGDT